MSNRLIHWATDTNYVAGGNPWNGQPLKVLPSAGAIQQGFPPNGPVQAEYVNFLFHVASNAVNGVAFADLRNWSPPITNVTLCEQVRYQNGTYYVAGSGGNVYFVRSQDPWNWPTANELAVTTIGNATDPNFDVKADGTIVIPASGGGVKDVVECNAAGVWTKHVNVFAVDFVLPDVVYDPVSTNWIIAGHKNGFAAVQVYTSTDRVNWTLRTPPAGTTNATLGQNGLGTIVAMCYAGPTPFPSNTVSFSASGDGGVTWTALDTHVTTFGNVGSAGSRPLPKPVWTGSKWVAIVSCDQNTFEKTHVYNSADGITWTEVAVLNTCLLFVASDQGGDGTADDGMLVATTKGGRLVYSFDAGATWTAANLGLKSGSGSGYPERIFSLNGGFVVSDAAAAKLRVSFLRGTTGAAVT